MNALTIEQLTAQLDALKADNERLRANKTSTSNGLKIGDKGTVCVYDMARLEALPEAMKLVQRLRLPELGNGAVWEKLFRVGLAINRQLDAEWKAYFAEEGVQ